MIITQRDRFIEALAGFEINANEGVIASFDKFAGLIESTNRSLRLLSRGDIENLWERHFLDSLAPLLLGFIEKSGTLLDVGSGAGLPGIPLALSAPEIEVTMVESAGKKARFIERAISELKITNAKVLNIRIEDLPVSESYDYCAIRAVALDDVIGAVIPHLKKNGKLVYFCGPGNSLLKNEMDSIAKRTGLKIVEIAPVPKKISEKGFSLVSFIKEV